MRKGGGCENDVAVHLSGRDWVYITSPYQTVQIRRRFLNCYNQVCSCSRRGISMKWEAWENYLKALPTILEKYPEIRHEIPCDMTHDSQVKFLECPECRPYVKEVYYN